MQHDDSSRTLDVMLEQHAKTAQTPKAAVGQHVIINKSLRYSDNRWRRYLLIRGMVLKPMRRSSDYFTKMLIC